MFSISPEILSRYKTYQQLNHEIWPSWLGLCISPSAARDALGKGKVRRGRGKWGSKGKCGASCKFPWQGCPVEIWPESRWGEGSGASSGGFGDSPRPQHLQQCPGVDSALTQMTETPLWFTTTTTKCFLWAPQTGYALCVPISPLGNLISELSWNATPV